MEAASGAVVREVYGCTESGYCAYGCGQGWLHLLQDWAIGEPVDATRVLVRPDPCPCGDPAPAIRVQGRASDVLTFPAADGRNVVTVPPLALGTVVDRTPGVVLFQIVQTAPASLSVRLRPDPAADGERVRRTVLEGITTLLADLGLAHVAVESAAEPPEQTTGGKYRTVIPLPARPPSS